MAFSFIKHPINLLREEIKHRRRGERRFHKITLDYPPSRRLEPRWGFNKPIHGRLESLFEANRPHWLPAIESLAQYKANLANIPHTFDINNSHNLGWLGHASNPLDMLLLYHFMASCKPKRYIEIGSGVTTLFAARAKEDYNLGTKIVSIDPFPRVGVDTVCDEVIRSGLEVVDLSIFEELEPGDIVFMDGSHRSFMNSDVTVFMLDVVPQLKPGVVVQIHDVVLPYDYHPMFSTKYWNEQYLLAAYLLGARENVQVLMPARHVSYSSPLKEAVRDYLKEWKDEESCWLEGGAFWFTHKAA